LAESFLMFISSWVMDPTRSCKMPSCSATDLVEFRPAVFQDHSEGWSLVWLCGTRRNASGKISMFKLGHPFFTVANCGTFFPNLSIKMAWMSFRVMPRKKTWCQLVTRCCWNRARRLTSFLSASATRRDLQLGTWADPSF
jgi:hypothetical protein